MPYIFLIAVSLALDAFAVSVTSGLTVRGFNIKHSLLMGTYFGMFQFVMPLLGWLLGSTVSQYVSRYGPWIAFALLAFIGGRMIVSALRSGGAAPIGKLTHRRLLVLAVATSIDAFAVGVSFAFMEISIWL
ncbi:MAG: manganese efflux pump, partial [Oscillospiraceae bacterium]|nr:manganese efflux pump [Oscillospiraceae bacterium]